MINDWDDAYANGAHIAGADGYVTMWEAKARSFREGFATDRRQVVAYGRHPRQDIEIFLPEGAAVGLFMFVHGGYWRSMERALWSHLAAGALERGWAVAFPGYVLCPEARISEITWQIAQALSAAGKRVSGPIRLAGHSAGGHLVARMGCANSSLAAPLAARIEKITSISGLHDLRPLMKTRMNNDLRLDLVEARAESPALLEPRDGFSLTCFVGADERPEFLRQNDLLANIWTGCGVGTQALQSPGDHHFSVIEGLEKADSALCRATFD